MAQIGATTVDRLRIYSNPDTYRVSGITFTVIPEPTTAALFALGGVGLMARRRSAQRG